MTPPPLCGVNWPLYYGGDFASSATLIMFMKKRKKENKRDIDLYIKTFLRTEKVNNTWLWRAIARTNIARRMVY